MATSDLNAWSGVGLNSVVLERAHQLDLGYDLNHDAKHHIPEELIRVGTCYIEFGLNEMLDISQDEPHPFFPEGSIKWTPEPTPDGYIIKGTAFILAGLDLKTAKEMTR